MVRQNSVGKTGAGPSLETVAVPSVGPANVLVRVNTASICGTDLHIYGWDRWSEERLKSPVTLGHEFCSTVVATGEEVTAVKPGELVSAEMHVNNGHCRQYWLGEAPICRNLRIIGIDQDGTFAEFVKIPVSNIWKLDRRIPEHYGAILDPLGNAVHTVLAGPIAGETVLVTGCGPIGLMSNAVAKACGGSTVFATETNEHRRLLAREMGADMVLHPGEGDPASRIRSATDGTGVDVLLEMSGNPVAIRQRFQVLRVGGRALLLGIPAEAVALDLINDVIFKGATIQGIYGRRMYGTWVAMTALPRAGRLDLDPPFRRTASARTVRRGLRDASERLCGEDRAVSEWRSSLDRGRQSRGRRTAPIC